MHFTRQSTRLPRTFHFPAPPDSGRHQGRFPYAQLIASSSPSSSSQGKRLRTQLRALSEHILIPHSLRLGSEVVSIARIQRGPPISPTRPTDTKRSAFPVAARCASPFQFPCITPSPTFSPPKAGDGRDSSCAHHQPSPLHHRRASG